MCTLTGLFTFFPQKKYSFQSGDIEDQNSAKYSPCCAISGFLWVPKQPSWGAFGEWLPFILRSMHHECTAFLRPCRSKQSRIRSRQKKYAEAHITISDIKRCPDCLRKEGFTHTSHFGVSAYISVTGLYLYQGCVLGCAEGSADPKLTPSPPSL